MNQDRISHSAVKAYLFVLLWFATDTWTAFLVAFLAVLVLTMLDVPRGDSRLQMCQPRVDRRREVRCCARNCRAALGEFIDDSPDEHDRGLDLARRIRQSRASR